MSYFDLVLREFTKPKYLFNIIDYLRYETDQVQASIPKLLNLLAASDITNDNFLFQKLLIFIGLHIKSRPAPLLSTVSDHTNLFILVMLTPNLLLFLMTLLGVQ